MVQKTRKACDLVKSVNESLKNKRIVFSNQSVLLALSGGQDSICLLLIVLQLKDQWNWKLSILYCNHLWQKDSFFTTTHVFKIAFLLHIPLCFGAALQMVFSEQKARKWRSLTFQRIHFFYKHNLLFTGHSNSDRIETSLFNLFRGSGLQGVLPLYWNKLNTLETFPRSQDFCFKNWFAFYLSRNKNNNKQFLHSLTKCVQNNCWFSNRRSSFLFPDMRFLPLKAVPLLWVKDQIQPQYFLNLKKGLHSTKTVLLSLENSTIRANSVCLLTQPSNLFLVKKEKESNLVLSLFLTKQSIPICFIDLLLNKGPLLPLLSVLSFFEGVKKGNCNISDSSYVDTKGATFLKSSSEKKTKLLTGMRFDQRSQPRVTLKLDLPNRFDFPTNKQHEKLTPVFTFKGKLTFCNKKATFPSIVPDLKKNLSIESFPLFSWDNNQKTHSKKQYLHKKTNLDFYILPIFPFFKTKKELKELMSVNLSSVNFKFSKKKSGGKPKPLKQLFVCTSLIEKKQWSKNLFVFSTTNVMLCKQNICWVIGRPLLCLNRFEITNLSHLWKLPLHPDKSNQNLQMSRNRMRKQMLPLLKLFFNPQIENSFSQFSEIVFQEEQYLSFLTKRITNQILQYMYSNKKLDRRKKGILVFNTSLFMCLPTIFKRRIVKLFLERVTTQKVTFTRILKAVHIIEKHHF